MDKNKSFLINTSAFSVFAIGIAIYAIFLPRDSEYFILQLLLFYLILLGLALSWNIAMLHKALGTITSDLAIKYGNMERLLMDVRDGTKTFYSEKRRSIRIRTDMLAKFVDKTTGDGFVRIDEISYEGARLKTTQTLKVGQLVKLNIYLPLFPQPVFVKVRVVRVRATVETKGTSIIFEVGVECVNIADEDREHLIETIDMLNDHIRDKKR